MYEEKGKENSKQTRREHNGELMGARVRARGHRQTVGSLGVEGNPELTEIAFKLQTGRKEKSDKGEKNKQTGRSEQSTK